MHADNYSIPVAIGYVIIVWGMVKTRSRSFNLKPGVGVGAQNQECICKYELHDSLAEPV